MKLLFIIQLALLTAGCTFGIPAYTVEDRNLGAVKTGRSAIQVIEDKPYFADTGSLNCRSIGSVRPPDGQTFSRYIANALRSELRASNLLDENAPNKLRMKVQQVEFSSKLGATYWYIFTAYSVNSEKFFISTLYEDRSSYLDYRACNNIALYFREAVAEHLRQVYSRAEFRAAIGFR